MAVVSAHRRLVAVWAVLCLTGAGATWALSRDPYADGPEFPAGSPTAAPRAGQSYDYGCEEIADEIARERAEAAREPVASVSPGGVPAVQTLTAYAVPEGCHDELEASLGVNAP
ncbi:hypothetical protein GCM10010259_20220 [Streptomyces daghestanicus]|uniref:Secreted protein n=1 Tax=Streptomyces daghestanicus TaxID=66885 RepID=A0ABQ3Q780_9ACTN|nr:hypothetical protein GCM10010259_20220 [Streptomyces daghestanicus]GHI33117.1 hypothetical protein Sdagh_48470 [Streptomyces daghestanicus]